VTEHGPDPADAADLRFYPRGLRWRVRKGDLLLFVDLPGAGAAGFFGVLAQRFPPAEVASSQRWPACAADLALVAADLRGARLMRARVDYEFYRFLPRPPSYVTLLRDPVDRVLALYDHVGATPGHPAHERVASGRLSLHDFVCDPGFAHEVVDAQARRIAGGMLRDRSGVSDRVLLQMAQVNLGEFAFFGIAERMPESVHLLLYTFGWAFPHDLVPRALAPEPVRREGLAPATLEAIEARTRVDHALVRFAGEQFAQRLRTALLDLLEQNARGSEPYLTVLGEHERLRKEYERLQRAWSWTTAETLKAWRRAVLPPGTRRDRLYQRVGTYLFARRASKP
jgi:hypothetical protein